MAISARLLGVFPGVRGLSVPITQGKTLRTTVNIQIGGNVPVDNPEVFIFIADELSPPTGDPYSDLLTWIDEQETSDWLQSTQTGIAPGTTLTFTSDIDTSSLTTGIKDVAVVLRIFYQGTEYYVDEYHENDAVEIVAPAAPGASIVSVSYEEV